MRFATTFQNKSARFLAICYVLGIPLIFFFAPDRGHTRQREIVAAWASWALMLPLVSPQYFEIREDGLFLQLRWRKRTIPYTTLLEVRDLADRKNQLRAEISRVRVTTTTGSTYTFAVEEKERFLSELSKRFSNPS